MSLQVGQLLRLIAQFCSFIFFLTKKEKSERIIFYRELFPYEWLIFMAVKSNAKIILWANFSADLYL